MYFDTHAHYDNSRFKGDRNELLASMPENGVSLILNAGCDLETSEASMGLAEKFPFIYAAAGWHPHEAKTMNQDSFRFLREAAAHPKVVAIGEIGLDYYRNLSPRDIQRKRFEEQMELAGELGLPVIIHDRQAHGDCMEVVRKFPQVKGVFHCYSGSAEMGRQLVDMGWYLSFAGSITFRDARRAIETISATPFDRIMIETDSPYLAPVPHRGQRCDSRYLPIIAQTIADIKGVPTWQVADITMENGRRFFGI